MPFVVLYHMSSSRRCVYTNKPANTRDTVIPKNRGDALHNWANHVPADSEYLKTKQNRLPNDLEMEAVRLFHLIELKKLEVTYLEERRREVQEAITGVKQDQIEKAHHIKDLTEGFEEQAKEVLEQQKLTSKKIWD